MTPERNRTPAKTRVRVGRTHAAPGRKQSTVADVRAALDEIAPPSLAQSWDNVGLILGDPAGIVRRVLLCIDLTLPVVQEAIRGKFDFIVAYHPLIFKPIHRVRADSTGTDASVFHCARAGIAVYSPHTALDAADGGTNDVLAALAGVRDPRPLEYADTPGAPRCKLVVFVPASDVERVADALFDAGAGRIGEYEKCSYRVSGRGTFFGGASTKPTRGARGRLEIVDEIRLETVVPSDRIPHAVAALRAAHPYEEPAFDLYPLKPEPTDGIGRVGPLEKPTSLAALARRLQRATGARCVQLVGDPQRRIERAVIVAGAAGSLPFRTTLCAGDVVITGEIRHHDALAIERSGAAAIALGHWASERPVLHPLAEALRTRIRSIRVVVSIADADPFEPL